LWREKKNPGRVVIEKRLADPAVNRIVREKGKRRGKGMTERSQEKSSKKRKEVLPKTRPSQMLPGNFVPRVGFKGNATKKTQRILKGDGGRGRSFRGEELARTEVRGENTKETMG